MRGYSQAAAFTKARVTNEIAIVKALRDGNTELAAQLQTQGELDRKMQFRSMFVTSSGRVRSSADVRKQARRERQRAARIDRRLAGIEGDDYITSAKRDSSGRITEGFDTLTGQNVKVDGEGNKYTVGKEGQWNWLRKGDHKNNARNEMESKLGARSAAAELNRDMSDASKSTLENNGTMQKQIGRLTQILEAWNN